MKSMAMVLLTLPIFVFLTPALDFGLDAQQVLIWFGILVLVSVEGCMISPPFWVDFFRDQFAGEGCTDD
jgi:TRAP-type mannitol/chloroaromatic compound transport system permease large subunit